MIDYQFILPEATEDRFFEIYESKSKDLQFSDENQEGDESQGSEILRSDDSIKIASKKVSGRLTLEK